MKSPEQSLFGLPGTLGLCPSMAFEYTCLLRWLLQYGDPVSSAHLHIHRIWCTKGVRHMSAELNRTCAAPEFLVWRDGTW